MANELLTKTVRQLNKFEHKVIDFIKTKGWLMAVIGLFALSTAVPKEAQNNDCLDFKDVAKINYTPIVWNETNHAYESVFSQRVKPGEVGYVEEIDYGGELFLQGKANPIVIFPIGANVTGYTDKTTLKKIGLEDGTFINNYTTCYSRRVYDSQLYNKDRFKRIKSATKGFGSHK